MSAPTHTDPRTLTSHDPATGEVVWEGEVTTNDAIDRMVAAARKALPDWIDAPLESRIAVLERYRAVLEAKRDALSELISWECGKPLWESKQELGAMIGKIALSIRAYHERRSPGESESEGIRAATRFKPFGVAAVLGPFNFPGHVPNGHIVPALLAGNAVVFKPSELTPAFGQAMAECWQEAQLPPGLLHVAQGAAPVGIYLVNHPAIDAVYFTGGTAAGIAINRALADQPGRIIALEMGGNNALVVHRAKDLDAAAYLTILSAYMTAGQRCTCARRLILVDDDEAKAFIDRLMEMTRTVRVGRYTDRPEPFLGPLIHERAAARVLAAQDDLIDRGGEALVRMTALETCPAMLRPGLIDVTNIDGREDVEHFGPLLQVIRVSDFDAAIEEVSHTKYGLVSALFSDDAALYQRFFRHVRAGLINWNRPTTGASGALPFGGVGQSGNHRPSGYYAADYCSYPVGSLEAQTVTMPGKRLPGVG